MKNLGILISKCFLLNLAYLEETKQSINHSISFFLTIIDLKMVLRELLGLTDLARAQTFRIHESTEVIIVSKDEKLLFAAF